MNKKIFTILLLVIVAFSTLTLVSATDFGNFDLPGFTVDAPKNSVFDGFDNNVDFASSSFDTSLGSSSDSQQFSLKSWEDKVNKIIIEDVKVVKDINSYVEWDKNESSGNLTVFVNPMKDDDFDDDTSDSDDLDKEDLKYAVLFDDGSHKLLFYGNDLAVLKKMANSVKFK